MGIKDTLQGMAALHTKLAQMDGHQVDKKAARFSAMADYMMHTGSLGQFFSKDIAIQSLSEAVETGIVGSEMNTPGKPFDRRAVEWMETDTGGTAL